MNTTIKPTTTKTLYALAYAAASTREDVLNSATLTYTYIYADHSTVTVVVSRRGGRLIRANRTTPTGPVERYTGTATELSRVLRAVADGARARL